MKKKMSTRILSLFLAIMMVAALAPILSTQTEAASGYAPAASDEDMDAVSQWFAANNGCSTTGTFAKVVNGQVYIWGSNIRNATGLTTWHNPETDQDETVTEATNVTVPVAMPKAAFGDSNVRLICVGTSVFWVITEKNEIYSWGLTGGSVGGYIANSAYPTIYKFDSANNMGKIEFIKTAGVVCYMRDVNKKWYTVGMNSWLRMYGETNVNTIAGWGGAYADYNTKYNKKAYPVPDAMVAKFAGGIKDVTNEWSYSCTVVSGQGFLYGFDGRGRYPANEPGAHVTQAMIDAANTANNLTGANAMNGYQVPLNYNLIVPAWKNLRFQYVAGDDWGVAVIDTNGDVWGMGHSEQGRFGWDRNDASAETLHGDPSKNKLFDHNAYGGAKAIRCWLSLNRTVVLCEDNTVWAMGDNSNGCIDASKPNENVYVMTQIYKALSTKATIVGIFPANNSMMAITKSGDMYFSGSNSSGGAAIGTTESKPAGVIHEVNNPALPPAAPLTKNQVIFEIEKTGDDGKTVEYYRPNSRANPNVYTKYTGRGRTKESTNASLTVDAGENFKLNVYFEDFGKLGAFVMPIRFDPRQIKVVNSQGIAYPSEATPYTPGSLGEAVGIEQHVNAAQWLGGQLMVGTNSENYPKIANGDGYVSIGGYTNDMAAFINGEVKMFSITFRAQQQVTGDQVYICLADKTNVIEGQKKGDGYDKACNALKDDKGTAHWDIWNPLSDDVTGDETQSNGHFAFADTAGNCNIIFPYFSATRTPLDSLNLTLVYGDNETPVSDTIKYNESATINGWSINWGNTTTVYTMRSTPTPAKASFPQVTWDFRKEAGDRTSRIGDATQDYLEYIQIVETGQTYVRFRVNPTFREQEGENAGIISFQATSLDNRNATVTRYVQLRSYQPPEEIRIYQTIKQDLDGSLVDFDNYVEDTTVIWTHTNNPEKNKYPSGHPLAGTPIDYFDFTPYIKVKAGTTIAENGAVVWSLMDKDRVAILPTDADAVARVDRTGDKQGVTVTPYKTTKGDDYLILRCESLLDPSVGAEVKIKIHLSATKLEFKPDTLRVATSTPQLISTVDLKTFLQMEPMDVYETDLTWRMDTTHITRRPANEDSDNVAPTPVMWGSLGSDDTASVFTAREWATPEATSAGAAEEYVWVWVKDNISGMEASVKIAIMKLDCPISPDQFVATNNIGNMADYMQIKSGLLEGDILRFYKKYEDAKANVDIETTASKRGDTDPTQALDNDPITKKYYSEVVVAAGQGTGRTYTVGDRLGSLYAEQGGYCYVTLSRKVDEGGGKRLYSYSPVPVMYTAEPSLVDGFVHLVGKNTGSSADAGITVILEGLNFREVVTTDAQGYFSFTKYIAPGTYDLTISKSNYLTRQIAKAADGSGGLEITKNSSGEFHISTYNAPLLLYPGAMKNSTAITVADINYFVSNWVGRTDQNIANFSDYDFYEDAVISTLDLELILLRKDWNSMSYPTWTLPKQQ